MKIRIEEISPKKQYENPQMEIIELSEENIVTTSSGYEVPIQNEDDLDSVIGGKKLPITDDETEKTNVNSILGANEDETLHK